MYFHLLSESSDYENEIRQTTNLVGVNGYSKNCVFSDKDFGYSLMYRDIGNWSGYFSIHDYLRRLPQDKHPNYLKVSSMECALLNGDSNVFYYITSHDFNKSTFQQEQFQLKVGTKGIIACKEFFSNQENDSIDNLVIDCFTSLGLKIVEKRDPKRLEFQGALILEAKLFLEVILLIKNLYGIFCYKKYIHNKHENVDPKLFLKVAFDKLLSNCAVQWVGKK